MKNNKRNLLSLVGAFSLLLHPSMVMAAPVIIRSTETAVPGDIIGIQGDSFGVAPKVWMQEVGSSAASLTPQLQLAVLNSNSASYVSAQIPPHLAVGLYAIWVKDGAMLSNPVFINKARAWGANDLCGLEVDSGRSFRLFGRNLYFPGQGTPTVNFVAGATSLAATVSGVDKYTLNVTAPAGLVAGTAYTLVVSNGMGGSQGSSSAIALTGRVSSSDPFGLGVPWGADYTFSGNVYNVKTDPRLALKAVGNGVTNDAPAIQAAINAANAAGGGVVYMPAGTYKISGMNTHLLTLKSNVVLKGDGIDISVLRASDTSLNSKRNIYGASVSKVGMVDITLYNTVTGYDWSTELTDCTKVFLLRTKLHTDYCRNQYWANNRQVLVKDSNFVGLSGEGVKAGRPVTIYGTIDLVFKNNTTLHNYYRVHLDNSVRSIIEGNHFTRSVPTGTLSAETGGLSCSNTHEVIVLGNTFDKVGAGPLGLVNGNDGETILCQGGGTNSRSQGTATSATATTLSDSSKNWVKNYSVPENFYAGQLYYVTIVAGPGLGQHRKILSNTTTTLTVDSPWIVLPTGASKYSIEQFHMRQGLIKGNVLSENPKGIWFYTVSVQDVVVVDNTLTNNGGIFFLADYRPADNPPTFNVQLDCSVLGNTVNQSTSGYAQQPKQTTPRIYTQAGKSVGYNTDFGTRIFGIDFRNNTLSAPVPNVNTGRNGEGFSSLVDETGDNVNVAALGQIMQGNIAINTQNGFHLTTGVYGAVLWGNSLINSGGMLFDNTEPQTNHASINTLIGSEPPSPWLTQDIGTVAAAGVTSYSSTGSFWLKASGADIFNAADEFQYAYQQASGDCEIRARVMISGTSNASNAKVGVMIREGLNTGSIHAACNAIPGTGTSRKSAERLGRATTGGGTASQVITLTSTPVWVRMVRTGNVFTAYTSYDGNVWTQLSASQTINMSSNAFIGICATSHNDGNYAAFTVDNVSLTP